MRVGSDFNGNPATMHERWGLGYNQWEVVLRMRDRYPLVTNPGAHPLTYQFSKSSNSLFWYITIVLKKKIKVKELAKECQLFDSSFMKTINSLRFFKQLELTIL